MAVIRAWVYATVERMDPYGNFDDQGYVEKAGSRVLEPARNYVSPVFEMDENDPGLMEEIGELFSGGSWYNNGEGSLYSRWDDTDENGHRWWYSVEFKKKYLGPKGWVEEWWVPKI